METSSERDEAALQRFNSLPTEEAESQLLSCCGSRSWALDLANQRPFNNVTELLQTANRVWWSIGTADWLEAFSAHPKIGERKAAAVTSEQAGSWSAQEQAGVNNAAVSVREELAELNRAYDAKFGFSFIVCATGKTSEEMLTILRERLGNDQEHESREAAKEQAKITELRIKKLLNQ